MKRLGKKKDLFLLATKLTEEIPDPRNANEHYQPFIRKKNTKSLKQSKIITQQPRCENPHIVDTKSIIIEDPKTLDRLSKTIKQSENVS